MEKENWDPDFKPKKAKRVKLAGGERFAKAKT